MVSQNTAEWLEMRKSKIGASDAPVIMEVSPYATPYQLWERKMDLAPHQIMHPGMKRGHDLEEKARQELEKMTDLFFLPQVKFHADIPWMMASLDGIDADNEHIVEIKCPNREDHQRALNGEIPDKYFPQLQHQLEVCQLEMGYYFSFDGTAGVIVEVYRDDSYIKKLIKKEEQFWECMENFVAPELIENDYIQKTDDVWGAAASEWIQLNQQLRNLEKREKELRSILISMCNNKNSMGAGLRISRHLRKGTVDYSSIPELQQVNLENYRKKPIECWNLSSKISPSL